MPLPESIREEFVHALATYSRRYEETDDEIRLTAQEAAESLLLISHHLGLIGYLPTVEKVFYREGILFVTVDGEDVEIPRW